jgi:hypothetical protein
MPSSYHYIFYHEYKQKIYDQFVCKQLDMVTS